MHTLLNNEKFVRTGLGLTMAFPTNARTRRDLRIITISLSAHATTGCDLTVHTVTIRKRPITTIVV